MRSNLGGACGGVAFHPLCDGRLGIGPLPVARHEHLLRYREVGEIMAGEDRSGGARTPEAVLAEAAVAARYAPSIHNTQPWRWQTSADGLDLHADRSRQLSVADPDGRLLLLSCGASLHHARVAMAAEGWEAVVERFPSTGDPDHLARITAGRRIPVTDDAMRMFQATMIRRTDRRPIGAAVPAPEALDALVRAAADEQTGLHVLRVDQVGELAAATERAEQIEVVNPAYRAELAAWVGGTRPDGTGIPDAAIPSRFDPSNVPGRDFGLGRPGTLPVGDDVHDAGAAYALLHGDSEQPSASLRAGEALSAVWLVATRHGLALVPLSATVEVAFTRHLLQRMLSRGYPCLALKVGVPDAEHPGPPPTPRLPL